MPNFIFCIHNHQPVGNFGHVIEESYKNAYLPFLKAVYKHPSIKLSFHITGYLLDWLMENHREYIDMLREMVKREQVEMMGGGYYEPILAVIPPQDRIGQIKMMADKLEKLFGKRPRGMWLAERIWEPKLPFYLKEAGMEYVVVDDYHFVKAGLRKEQLSGYYITEDLGKALKVFPGSERLRYIIPFQEVERFTEYLQEASRGERPFGPTTNSEPRTLFVFADDGEKFGTWPGTHQWVYKEGWLEKFLETISENKELIKPVTFSEYMDNNEPIERVYLPTTSYMEMGEWALPAEASEAYTNLVNEVKSWPDGERIRRFMQGGFWRNFFAKYPEANWMHKRMLMVSEEIAGCGTPPPELRTYLYKAQCNDAYWHGIFGGLYLPHLRTAVYENLIMAESLIEEVRSNPPQAGSEVIRKTADTPRFTLYERDLDADTFDEIFIRTPAVNLFLSPHNGGSIAELDYRPKGVNLSNTLARWEEGYHHKVKKQTDKTGSGEAKSIHDLTISKEEGLEKHLFFDRQQRLSLRDHFLKKDETLDAFRKSAHEELGDFFNGCYENKGQGSEGKDQIVLGREGNVSGQSIFTEKAITIKDNEIEINYVVKKSILNYKPQTANPELSLKFGVEFNLILPCCNGMEGFYDIPGNDKGLGSSGEINNIKEIALIDKWTKIRLSFSFDRDASLWRFPVETVSISEAGFERIFQGSCLLFFWDISLENIFETNFKIKLESI